MFFIYSKLFSAMNISAVFPTVSIEKLNTPKSFFDLENAGSVSANVNFMIWSEVKFNYFYQNFLASN